MTLRSIIENTADISAIIENILTDIHENGPVKPEHFETLAYLKKYHYESFITYESKLIYLLGLFFKTLKPRSLIEAVYNNYAESIEEDTGKVLTPVQANIYQKISDKTYFSFSAPTSTGKSYLFRELISEFKDDIVIIVPSRALIAEYISAILKDLKDDKSVLIMQFAENVNTANITRRIYVITPERAADLFKITDQINIGMVLFDEAQISEDLNRGMTFDALVRRVDKKVPNAKKVFTHPFVNNPNAQLKKHNFNKNSAAQNYEQHSVGKIFISEKNGDYKFFSPYEANKANNINEIGHDPISYLLSNGKTILIYVSKAQIYKREHIEKFKKYIHDLPKIKSREAKGIINQLRNLIGASKDNLEKYSHMIDLMDKGIVIHHGSIPLKGRLLIEKFVNHGHARICFATSTLIQGINMPFDAVWIESFKFYGSDNDKTLGMKNLIGRSGRTTIKKNNFDYGYVIIKEASKKLFVKRLTQEIFINEKSQLDESMDTIPEDGKDLAEAMKNDTFNSDLNLTESQIKRIKDKNVTSEIEFILNHFILDNKIITASKYRKIEYKDREKIKENFQKIYLSHLRKENLNTKEKHILSTSISILLWRVQGKSFKEIISLRHSYIARKSEQRAINKRLKFGEITESQALEEKRALKIKPSQQADRIPNSDAGKYSLFDYEDSVLDVDYDRLVFDTYDYLDKVIAQCLVDPITGALQLYYEETNDERSLILSNYIRYGTNDARLIWLLKYGFDPEDIEWIKKHTKSIDEKKIVFNPSINKLPKNKFDVISRFTE